MQALLLPIADRHHGYAQEVAARLKARGFRAEVDARNEKVGKKIAEAEQQKIPYMLVMGDRDAAGGNVSVRKRGEGDLGAMPVDGFIERLREETS